MTFGSVALGTGITLARGEFIGQPIKSAFWKVED